MLLGKGFPALRRFRERMDPIIARHFPAADPTALMDLLENDPLPSSLHADIVTHRAYQLGALPRPNDRQNEDMLIVSGIGWSATRDHAVLWADFTYSGEGAWAAFFFFVHTDEGWKEEGLVPTGPIA